MLRYLNRTALVPENHPLRSSQSPVYLARELLVHNFGTLGAPDRK